MASSFPVSSVSPFLITSHRKYYLPPSLILACDLQSGFLRGAPDHVLHSSFLSSFPPCYLLQGTAESSLSWEHTATLQERPLSHFTGQFPWCQAEQGSLPLTPPGSLPFTTAVTTPDIPFIFHIYIKSTMV